jgi:hypothetical protein
MRGILTKGTTTLSLLAMEMAWPVANGNFNDDNFPLSRTNCWPRE